MKDRALTAGEVALCRPLYGDAIEYEAVRIHHRKWWPFHPRSAVMAPDGDIWCHPQGDAWREDFSVATSALQQLLIHEMCHVWQAQRGGRWYLPLVRHPLCRYDYVLKPGKLFRRYGIEQQAEIVAHAFRARLGGMPSPELEALLAEAFSPRAPARGGGSPR